MKNPINSFSPTPTLPPRLRTRIEQVSSITVSGNISRTYFLDASYDGRRWKNHFITDDFNKVIAKEETIREHHTTPV